MSGQEHVDRSAAQSLTDCEWLALQYALQELDEQSAAEFEALLAADPDLCELLADSTLLLDDLRLALAADRELFSQGSTHPAIPSAIPSIGWQTARSATPVAPRRTAASLLVMMCGVLGLSAWLVGTGNQPADRTLSHRSPASARESSASPATVLQHWTRLSAAGEHLAAVERQAGSDLSLELSEADSFPSAEDSQQTPVQIPDWLLAAVEFSLDPTFGDELPLERSSEGGAL